MGKLYVYMYGNGNVDKDKKRDMKNGGKASGKAMSAAFALLLAGVLLLAFLPMPALAATAITNCTELQNIHNNSGGDYYLANDINCSGFDYGSDGKGFMPIGNWSNKFNGTFDGQGYKITHLYINRSSTDYVGLFGCSDSGSEIKNVGLEEVNVSGDERVGGLVGSNREGTITNSYSSGTVSGSSSYVGGLVGSNYEGTITNSYSYGTVSGSSFYVGGLVGSNREGTITNSYSSGSVSGAYGVGGLVGSNYNGTITNSYSSDSVSGSFYDVGGLVGSNYEGTITNSYSSGTVSGANYVGGLVGHNADNGTITNSYSSGSVSSSSFYLGGLVGYNSGTITNSYSSGSVSGSSRVGGLVGYNYKGTITNSYSSGSVSGSSFDVGGLVGSNHEGTITNSYWDTETSGQFTSAGGTGKTTAEMKQQATFGGWDFNTIWGIVEHVSYPYLQWQSSIIIAFAPPSPVNDTVCTWRTFNVTVNHEVNVSWYLNNSLLDTNVSVTEANYTLHAEFVGDNNVSAVAKTANGTDMQTWIWNVAPARVFDTGSPANPYPSIMGNHTGTIKPNHPVIATKLYTYPCTGTGGHTEYAEIWNATWNATATWEGYVEDWHTITFDKTVVLLANETYNYNIRTGSYPRIIHAKEFNATGGTITCDKFIDANGRIYYDGIPAIRLHV